MAPARRRKRRYRFFVNLFRLIAGLGIVLIVVLYFAGTIETKDWIYPSRNGVDEQSGIMLSESYRSVEFQTQDGLTLRGWYIPSENGAAVMVMHGHSANRTAMLPQAQILVRHGYGVLLFDLRAHGNSDGDMLSHLWYDGIAADNFLEQQPEINTIGAYGFSLGGVVAIQAAAQDGRIMALMVDGPGPAVAEDMPSPSTLQDWIYLPFDLGFFPALQQRRGGWTLTSNKQALATIAPRSIFFVSEGDAVVQGFYDAAKDPKFLWAPGPGHGAGIAQYPEEYERRMIEFFDAYLLSTTTEIMREVLQ